MIRARFGSLRWRIVLGSLAVQLVVLAALVVNTIDLMSRTLERQADQRLAEITALLNAAVSPLLMSEDHGAIEALFDNLVDAQGLSYLVALDRRGREVARAGTVVEPTGPPAKQRFEGWSPPPRYDGQADLVLAGQVVGRLRVGLSTGFLAQARDDLLRQAGVLLLLTLAVTTAVLALLGHWWTRPLRRLEAASRELAAGGTPPPLLLESRDEVGSLARAFDAMSRQLTERLAELSASEARMRAVFEQSAVGILFADLDRRLLRVNDQMAAMLGWQPHEVIGHDYRDFFDDAQPGEGDEILRQLASGQTPSVALVRRLRRRDGGLIWARITATLVRHGDGAGEGDRADAPRALLAVVDDVSESRAAEERIRQLAFYDPLTALPNRRLLGERLAQAMRLGARSGRYGALMMLDLDAFKALNDTRGHDVGDRLLVAVAERLVRCVRDTDSVARLGGDEFVLLLEDLGDSHASAREHADVVAAKIQRALAEPFLLVEPRAEHHQSASIGMVLFAGTAVSAETLLKQADLALYQAKDAGRNTLRLFDPGLQSAIDARVALEARLRRALALREFAIHLQPQVNSNGAITGAEALLRWQPGDGAPAVSPAEFIPLAEETGLIVPIGQWVLDEACAVLARWATDPMLGELCLSVNISARQFRQPDFVSSVRDALARHGAPANRLGLEITESMLLDDLENCAERMHALRELGLVFSLDDFGTGYSSLAYLKQLPFDHLKIDRSFVRDIGTDPNDAAIVGAITAMSRSLGLRVIAEGVETAAQRAYLLACGCERYQGWLYAAAMPRVAFEGWVRERQPAVLDAV